jgi:flagellar biosynthesis/type III secretory pathway M-ring protein FliF/YscJ
MASHSSARRKRSPSWHQRQMRFFTVAGMVVLVVLVAAILWFINRPVLAGQ